MVSIGRSANGIMATSEDRLPVLATCILAATLVGLPWVDAGLSPAGQASVVLLVVMAGAAWWLSRETQVALRFSPLLALGVLLACASATQSIYPDRTIQALLLLMAYMVGGGLAASGTRKLPWTERMLLGASALSGLLVVGIGLIWLAHGNGGGFYASVLIGPFGYPNALAGFLLLVGGAAAATLQPDRWRIERRLALVGVVACVLGLYFARSRGAWVAAGVGFVSWIVMQRRAWWPHRWRWGTLAAFVFLAGLGIVGGRLAHPLSSWWWGSAGAPVDTSVQWRLSILQWTWSMIRDHPWLGVGPGAFPVALAHYQQIPYVGGENPHNLYLEIAAEYGVVAGVIFASGIIICLGRAILAVQRLPIGDPGRSRRAALLAGFVAFAVHSGMDLDWSFPAVGLLGAVILGLMIGGLPRLPSRPSRLGSFWRVAMPLALAATAALALTRFCNTTLVSWGRDGLAAGSQASAERYLTWASRMNPLSYPAMYWLAWARLRSGDTPGAMKIAERTLRIAPEDPNTHALAGDMALAAGRWEASLAHFQRAVDRAPATQLRFHSGLLDAAAAAGKPAEALRAYARALSLFTEERVLGREARCLAPGDRYLLARMSRVAAHLYPQDANPADPRAAVARADRLSQPDPRGICATGGPPGQTSPEIAIVSFWTAWTDGGFPAAERLLLPERRRTEAAGSPPSETPQPDKTRRVRVDRVYSLTGGGHRATVVYQVEREGSEQLAGRCATTAVRFTSDGWLLEALPVLGQHPCSP